VGGGGGGGGVGNISSGPKAPVSNSNQDEYLSNHKRIDLRALLFDRAAGCDVDVGCAFVNLAHGSAYLFGGFYSVHVASSKDRQLWIRQAVDRHALIARSFSCFRPGLDEHLVVQQKLRKVL